MNQLSLFNDNEKFNNEYHPRKPDFDYLSTRYQGSKVKILEWIWSFVQHLEFESCLDAFGGTGSVAYLFKRHGKKVAYNDNLKFNYTIGKAIIENDKIILEDYEIQNLLTEMGDVTYPSFIQDTFKDIFFLDEENKWLDKAITNIKTIKNDFKRSIAFTALFQACIIKRPYNLFHRANLYMRTADVKRNFGNKTTWDKPFPHYFRKFTEELNSIVFSNGKKCRAFCKDVFEIKPGYDLVYIDTPYMSEKGVGVDYLDFYHFLEGMLDYDSWKERVDLKYKHRRLKGDKSLWCRKDTICDAFSRLFEHFKDSILAVSYRSHGVPGEDELVEMMAQYKNVKAYNIDYKYVLSHRNGQEILLIGT